LSGWKRVEWRRQPARDLPVAAFKKTAENDDEDEKDWEVTLRTYPAIREVWTLSSSS
jgi:hypothetical protein